jgi:hypothetical protein
MYVYVGYVILSIALTVWVGLTLRHNGRVVLMQEFGGNVEMVNAVSRPLTIGFFLTIGGYIAMTSQWPVAPFTGSFAIQAEIYKFGFLLILLGLLHFLHILALATIRRTTRNHGNHRESILA